MFRHDGPSANPARNWFLAGYLALTAGFVNAGGFVLVGTFTSHVTGSVGRMAVNVAGFQLADASFAAIFVLAFFAGAFVASLIVEWNASRRAVGYGIALAVEALTLLAFALLAGVASQLSTRAMDQAAILLSFAMGLQNALVTRLSGAVIRTTHLTGVVTDLGIEASRWIRGHRVHESTRRTEGRRIVLLATIAASFTLGAFLGAMLTFRASRWAMVAPAVAIAFASGLAFRSHARGESLPPSVRPR
ncbi:MAG: YoaK family protein [Polyangiaceae bacterium]